MEPRLSSTRSITTEAPEESMRIHSLSLASALLALATSSASGAFVAFHDLGNPHVAEGFPTITTGWSTGTSYELLNYLTGASTGVSLELNNIANNSSNMPIPEYVGDFAALFPPQDEIDYRGSLFLGGTTSSFTLSGLQPGWMYDLAVISDRAYEEGHANVGREATFTLLGADSFVNTSSSGTTISGDDDESTTVTNGRNPGGLLVRYSSIVAGEDGTITLSAVGSGYIGNAIRLEAIPEPSTALLAGLGALALLRRRAR